MYTISNIIDLLIMHFFILIQYYSSIFRTRLKLTVEVGIEVGNIEYGNIENCKFDTNLISTI